MKSKKILYLILLGIIEVSFLAAEVFGQEQIPVTVGIVSYQNSEIPSGFSERVTKLQNKITNLLSNPEHPDVDLVFEPEWILVIASHSSNDPAIVEITDNGDGTYSLASIGTTESDIVANHINWLMSTAAAYNVNFFTNIHERIDISSYGWGVNYIHGTTGLVIGSEGNVIGIKRKYEFYNTYNLPAEWRDIILGPTIRSFSLLSQEGKEFVILPFICGDLWSTDWVSWFTQKLKENNSEIADIVIHPIAMGDWCNYELFTDIQAGTFDPDNPPENAYDWFWNPAVEDILIQHYMLDESLIRTDNSYYFITDKYGFGGGGKNLAGFELVAFPPGPEAFPQEGYAESDDYLVIRVSLDRNHAPKLSCIGDKTVVINNQLTFYVTATDQDGDQLSFSAPTLPIGATFVDNGNNTAIFSWTPTDFPTGDYDVTFSVSDGFFSDSETITITVKRNCIKPEPIPIKSPRGPGR